MYKGAIIIKNSGLLVPVKAFESTVGLFPSCYGAATAYDGQLIAGAVASKGNIPELMKSQEENQDVPMIFYFGNYSSGFLKDDMQPFTLLSDDEGRKLLMAFLEGDFGHYAKEGSTHSPESFVVSSELVPKIKLLNKMCDGDLSKIMEALGDDSIHGDMTKLFADRGVVTIFAANGQILSYSENALEGTFPWGWMSQVGDYKEGEAKKEASSGLGLTGFRSGNKQVTSKAPPASSGNKSTSKPAPVEAKPDVKTDEPVVEPGKTDTVVPGDAGKGVEIQCPTNVQGKNAIRAWYHKHAGFCPDGYKNRPKVTSRLEVGATKAVPDTAMAAALVAADASANDGKRVDAGSSKPTGKVHKDTSTKHVASTSSVGGAKPTAAEAPASEPIPVLSADQKKYIVDDFLKGAQVTKSLDAGSKDMIDPAMIADIESKFPTFTEQTGLKNLGPTLRWDFKSLSELGTYAPEALAMLLIETRNELIKHLASAEKAPITNEVQERPAVRNKAVRHA